MRSLFIVAGWHACHGGRGGQPAGCCPGQVLLSQVHRLRALVLLGRFLDMGAWAVDLALSVGIFPYVLKLLQTTATDLRPILVFIWTKILACDHSCQVQPGTRWALLDGSNGTARAGQPHPVPSNAAEVSLCAAWYSQSCLSPASCKGRTGLSPKFLQADLIKDNGHQYFIKFLEAPDAGTTAETRAQAAFVLATICRGCGPGRANYRAHQVLAEGWGRGIYCVDV